MFFRWWLGSVFWMRISLMKSLTVLWGLLWARLNWHEFAFYILVILLVLHCWTIWNLVHSWLDCIILADLSFVFPRLTWSRWLPSAIVSLILLANSHGFIADTSTHHIFGSFVRSKWSHMWLLGNFLIASNSFGVFRSWLIRLNTVLHVLKLVRRWCDRRATCCAQEMLLLSWHSIWGCNCVKLPFLVLMHLILGISTIAVNRLIVSI